MLAVDAVDEAEDDATSEAVDRVETVEEEDETTPSDTDAGADVVNVVVGSTLTDMMMVKLIGQRLSWNDSTQSA